VIDGAARDQMASLRRLNQDIVELHDSPLTMGSFRLNLSTSCSGSRFAANAGHSEGGLPALVSFAGDEFRRIIVHAERIREELKHD